jgi:hypothetical protein
MSKYAKVEYKSSYIKGFLTVRSILKTKYNQEITPNEYYNKYVTKIDDTSLDKYERIIGTDRVYLYRMDNGWKYLLAILPNFNKVKDVEE